MNKSNSAQLAKKKIQNRIKECSSAFKSDPVLSSEEENRKKRETIGFVIGMEEALCILEDCIERGD